MRKIKPVTTYYIYKIVVDEQIVYVGRTTDLHRRELQHNNLIQKDLKKELYKYLRSLGIDKIHLITVTSFNDKVQAKRYELYLLLKDYFLHDKKQTLKQRIPSITDQF